MGVPDILKRIIHVKHDELTALAAQVPPGEWKARVEDAPPPRGFYAALKRATGVGLIAEVKKASPSKGIIRADFDPLWIASRYEEGGATCLSVLTDEQFFQGCLDYLVQTRKAVGIPVLRKDFTIASIQLYEARAAGADAILLIAACLDPVQLVDLHAEAEDLGMDALVEIHDAREWEAVMATGLRPKLVGINNRNLRDFSVTLDTTRALAPAVLETGALLVAESGIFTPDDVKLLQSWGASAILVGESLMRQPDPGVAARELLTV